jgi:hypothetical protein
MLASRKWVTAAAAFLLGIGVAHAAYLPGGVTVLQNPAGQDVGVQQLNNATTQPTLPIITQPAPAFPPPPPILPTTKWGNFLGNIIQVMHYITDGVYNMTFAGPNKSPQPAQAAAVVNFSPNPSLQCPLTAPVNQTANTTVITNPGGGKSIHVCGVVLISATQQGITIAEGTGTACATNPVYWDGGSGGTLQVAANGGYAAINQRIIYPMQAAGDNVCVIQSGAGNVSGHINYGIFSQ